MKLGVICDGISRDLKHALTVMDEYDLKFAELQFVWDKEIGDHDRAETRVIKQLLREHGKNVSCLSRHLFAGTTVENKPNDQLHLKHMDYLKRVIQLAHEMDSPLVRIMSPKKETIVWGENGAEVWNVAKGAWRRTIDLLSPAVDIARSEGITLVVETGNGTMINSAYMARRIIDEMDASDALQVLWDPANCCWCHEIAYPNAFDEIRGGYLGHIHIKDVYVDTPRSMLKVREFGKGQLGEAYRKIGALLIQDGFEGVVSFESVFHPGDLSFEHGFRMCVDNFKSTFGGAH